MRIDILNNKNIPNFNKVIEYLETGSIYGLFEEEQYIICSNSTLEYLKCPNIEFTYDAYKPLAPRWCGYKVLIDNELPEGVVDVR